MMPEVTRIVVVPPPQTLWRVDTVQPKPQWDMEHAKKTLYGAMEGILGPKNQAGLFFFHSDSSMSLGCAREMMRRHKSERAWLTRCEAKDELKLFDFSLASNIYQVLRGLCEHGMDVMQPEFLTMDEQGVTPDRYTRSFADFKADYEFEQNGIKTRAGNIRLNQTSIAQVSSFGQRLTDFKNGPAFRKVAEASGLGIDGYRWREGDDPHGLTYCLFSSEKLSPPTQVEYGVRGLSASPYHDEE